MFSKIMHLLLKISYTVKYQLHTRAHTHVNMFVCVCFVVYICIYFVRYRRTVEYFSLNNPGLIHIYHSLDVHTLNINAKEHFNVLLYL